MQLENNCNKNKNQKYFFVGTVFRTGLGGGVVFLVSLGCSGSGNFKFILVLGNSIFDNLRSVIVGTVNAESESALEKP